MASSKSKRRSIITRSTAVKGNDKTIITYHKDGTKRATTQRGYTQPKNRMKKSTRGGIKYSNRAYNTLSKSPRQSVITNQTYISGKDKLNISYNKDGTKKVTRAGASSGKFKASRTGADWAYGTSRLACCSHLNCNEHQWCVYSPGGYLPDGEGFQNSGCYCSSKSSGKDEAGGGSDGKYKGK